MGFMEVTEMQKNKTKLLSAILLTLGSAGTAANAQTQLTGFSGSAEAKVSHDDNIYRTTDEFAQSDSLITLTPEAKLAGIYGKHRFQINYNGDYAKHFDLDDANYDDHTISVRADLDHSLRFKTRFEAAYIDEHQDPGVINLIQLDLNEYNLYNETRYGAYAFYGSEDSIGHLEFHYKKADVDYTNNNLDFLDNSSDEFGAKFIYRISDKTKTYVEAIYTEYNYTPPTGAVKQDNTNIIYRAGVSWDFANKLSGDVNAGYQDREFDAQGFRSTSGLTYDGSVTWSISSFTKIDFEASRQALDSTIEQLGSFTRTSFATALSHEFTERLSLEASVRYFKDNIDLNILRKDKRLTYSTGLKYSVTQTIDIGASYKYQNRDSNIALAEYESNIVSLSVNVAI